MAKLKRKQKMHQAFLWMIFLWLIVVLLLHISMTLFHGIHNIGSYPDSYSAPSLELERHGSASSSASTSLASKQSYGFFNDILDHNWKYKQEQAERIHNSVKKMHSSRVPTKGGSFSSQTLVNSLQPDFTCPHMTRVGGQDDATWTCDPHRLLQREDCVIYSIGSSDGTYEWEEALIDLLGSLHCEIHVFDPGNYARAGDPELKNIHYHQWGIKGSSEPSLRIPGERAPKMLTIDETFTSFDDFNQTIDVLKFNCDDCEW
jgi:hypothetical protein